MSSGSSTSSSEFFEGVSGLGESWLSSATSTLKTYMLFTPAAPRVAASTALRTRWEAQGVLFRQASRSAPAPDPSAAVKVSMAPESLSASPNNSSAPLESSPMLNNGSRGASMPRVRQNCANCSATSLSLDRVIWIASLKPAASILLAVTATMSGTGASFFPSTSRCPLPRPRTLILACVAMKMSRMLRPPLPMSMGTRSKSGCPLCRKMWHQRRAACLCSRPDLRSLASTLPLRASSAACAPALRLWPCSPTGLAVRPAAAPWVLGAAGQGADLPSQASAA
mmetsp:Transcript_141938/g.395597  ORF Transcript_141938/g.395597 Transcript_141938/m.395597 type:complete len:282 (-) Transcript_141938:103-948(-)